MTNPVAVEIDRKLLTFWIGEAAEVDARELLHKAAVEIRRLQRLVDADEPSRSHRCPLCLNTEISRMELSGQDSYECLRCNRWGPWEDTESSDKS